jgi:hypothetical protein
MYVASYKIYQGYYYEINNKVFAGKEFNINAPELVKIDSAIVDTLLTQASTYTYGKLSKLKINTSNIQPFYFIPTEEEKSTGEALRYFASKKNQTPILIKEINKENYDLLKTNSLYNTVTIKNYIIPRLNTDNNYTFAPEDLKEAEMQIIKKISFNNL